MPGQAVQFCMQPMATQNITGKRIRLRPVRESDRALLGTWWQDKELQYWMGGSIQPEDCAGWIIEQHPGHPNGQSDSSTSVRPRRVGHIELVDWSRGRRSAEIQLFIGDARYRGNGLGTEAIRLLVRHVFCHTSLDEVYLRVYSDNRRAIRCYRRCGFRPLGRLRSSKRICYGGRDLLLMSLQREDFFKVRSK